jgi:lipoprotein-anchoring transpeptidase ErfK/SrfK
MKKKFSLEIKTPCHENFNNMIPNANGSFCNSCAKNVIDLSTKTNLEVAQFIAKSKDKNICARLNVSQLEQTFEFETHPKNHNFKYAVAVAASILLTSNVVAQENQAPKTEQAPTPKRVTMGKMMVQHKKEVSIVIQGKILDSKTKKPISETHYPNLSFFAYGATKSVKINPKTGEYTIELLVNENAKTLIIYISNEDFRYSKEVPLNTKDKTKTLNILVNPEEEFQSLKIMGGMGVNYIDNKKNITS